jgi:hypothetical protein
MPKANSSVLAWNRGILSRRGAARVDLSRYAMAAEEMTNWMPRVLGSMMLRPGWEYTGATKSNARARGIPFIFSADDLAHLELTDSVLRVWIDDVLVTRATVTAAITNGTFASDISGWTDSDESGATSAWASGSMSLVGTGTNSAIREQQVTVNQAGTEHALRIEILRGPVVLKVGSVSGTDDYITETTLGTGTHSLAFTPTGNFYVNVSNARIPASLVDSITIEAAGVMELPTPWTESVLANVRHDQSGDIIYVACSALQQRKIERRAAHSWSVVLYEPEDGPFRVDNVGPITLTPSALTGDITLTASKALFRSTNVRSLFRITSTGQQVTKALTGEDQFSDPIRVAGIDSQRIFQVTIAGTWVATVTLQYSVGAPGSWVDAKTWTANATSENYDDTLDNQIIYYRIGIKSGAYTSGTANVTLSYASGSLTGIVRITAYSSSTSVTARVLTSLGGTTGSAAWAEGAWSDRRGWPSAVRLHEGRLGWFGKDKIYESVSDGYESFDDTIEGDSGPIQRSLGEGPIDSIYWAISLGRLVLGTASIASNVDAARIDSESVLAARSSSLDEPLTPTNFNLKIASATAVFVDRSGQRLMQIIYDAGTGDYKVDDLALLVPDLNSAGITRIAVQRQPDTRVHCVRSDGTVGILIFDRGENVICWIEVETDGFIEDVSVLPGTGEDQVYYLVRRTINNATVRFREKWAMEDECTGRPGAFFADAHYRYSGSAVTTISGLGHLEGESVVVWGWNTTTPFLDQLGNEIGLDFGTFTVSGGAISGLSDEVTDACVGLGYTAQWKSMRQAFAAALGTALNQRQRIGEVGLILQDTHASGIQYGPDFSADTLQDIPQDDLPRDDAGDPDTNHVFEEHEMDMAPFDGIWGLNSRFCLQAAAPKPVAVLACTVQLQTSG